MNTLAIILLILFAFVLLVILTKIFFPASNKRKSSGYSDGFFDSIIFLDLFSDGSDGGCDD